MLDYFDERAPRIGISAALRIQRMPFGAVAAHTVFAPCVTAVSAAGAVPLLLPSVPDVGVRALLDAVDALVLPGGPDLAENPTRDRWESSLLRAALARTMPVLAICRGLQLANVVLGGTLVRHVDGHLGESIRHAVDIATGSQLAEAIGTSRIVTNSLHHQAVDAVGTGLTVTARAHDGTVEALEAPGLLAVQWHPELESGRDGAALFSWLATEAKERAWTSR